MGADKSPGGSLTSSDGCGHKFGSIAYLFGWVWTHVRTDRLSLRMGADTCRARRLGRPDGGVTSPAGVPTCPDGRVPSPARVLACPAGATEAWTVSGSMAHGSATAARRS